MTAHAKLSPSGSKRWFACPGSIQLESTLPDKTNAYADDGTAMHEIAARCLRLDDSPQQFRAHHYIDEQIPVHREGEEPRYVEFTEEMADLVQGYVDTVRVFSIGNQRFVEKRVNFSEFVDLPDQFGTADTIVVDDQVGELILVDLKTGHTPVNVEKNSQLMLYALGALRFLLDEQPSTMNLELPECDLV